LERQCYNIGYSLLYLIETTYAPDLAGTATELEAARMMTATLAKFCIVLQDIAYLLGGRLAGRDK
jgi:hypothetical protein